MYQYIEPDVSVFCVKFIFDLSACHACGEVRKLLCGVGVGEPRL